MNILFGKYANNKHKIVLYDLNKIKALELYKKNNKYEQNYLLEIRFMKN